MTSLGQGLEVRDGHLCFNGVNVVGLALHVGTPFFLYSESRIRWNIGQLVNAFTRRHLDTEIFFASKACSNLWFLDRVRRAGINVEVNAGGELRKALRTGFLPDQIVFNGVAKTRTEIGEALEAQIRAIVVDSSYELERVAEVARDHLRVARVDLRVDVNVETLTHPGLETAHGGKAGIDMADVVDTFALAVAHEFLEPTGLHMHVGSQITDTAPYSAAMEAALDLVEKVEAACDLRLDHVNAGGGIPVPYRDVPVCEPVDYFCAPLAPDDYAAAVCDPLERRRPDLRLYLEPGRAIAGDTAILVTRVENEKVKGVRDAAGRRVGEERWLIVDAGFNTLLEHTNYHWYYRTLAASRAAATADTEFRLAGPLCDGGDVFAGDDETAYRRFPAATTVGDVIVFLDTGAYTLEMMNPYNARPRAAAFAVRDGAVIQIRAAESFDEMIAQDIEPDGEGGRGPR